MPDFVDYLNDFSARWKNLSDRDFLTYIDKFPPVCGEGAAEWDTEEYWIEGLYQFLSLVREAERRKLAEAIPLLLDRATEYDPDNQLESMRHSFEAIMEPNWAQLADICLARVHSDRPGTRKWSLYQLMILNDIRAESAFEQALKDRHPDIRGIAEIALQRLRDNAAS